jgi:MFS family permease
MPHNVPRDPARPGGVRHWAPLGLTCTATFVLLVYATIVTVALPAITADLHAGFSVAQWLIDGYTLALAGLLMGMGALGDAVGHRRLFGIGLWAFAAATLACGLAPGPGTLVAARIVQGLAAAALFGTLLPLIGQSYEGRDRATAFAAWGTVSGIGGAAGTLVGGILAQYLSWRWIFLAAVPICVVTAVLAMFVLPGGPRRSARLDLPGIATLTVAASAVIFGAITAGDRGWTSSHTLTGLTLGLVALGLFVVVERRASAPVMPPGLVSNRAFVGLLLAAGGYYSPRSGCFPPCRCGCKNTEDSTHWTPRSYSAFNRRRSSPPPHWPVDTCPACGCAPPSAPAPWSWAWAISRSHCPASQPRVGPHSCPGSSSPESAQVSSHPYYPPPPWPRHQPNSVAWRPEPPTAPANSASPSASPSSAASTTNTTTASPPYSRWPPQPA